MNRIIFIGREDCNYQNEFSNLKKISKKYFYKSNIDNSKKLTKLKKLKK